MRDIPRHNLSFSEEVVENGNEAFDIAKDLIENLFFDMSKLCTNYCDEALLWDPPYTYSERRLDCVLLPVLSKLCNSLVFTEYPTRRQSTATTQTSVKRAGSTISASIKATLLLLN